MKILFVSAGYNPFSPKKGGSSQRSHLLLEALAKVAQVDVAICIGGVVSDIPNCQVVFSKNVDVWYHGFGNRKNKFKRLLRPWDPYSFFPLVPQAAKEMGKLIEEGNYDLICTRYVETALTCGLMQYSSKLIVDVDDYPVDDMVKMSRMAPTLRSRVYYSLLSRAMRYSINKTIRQCRYVYTPNRDLRINPRTSWLPNIPFYDCPTRNPIAIHDNPVILFVGGLSYMPNMQGIGHFIKNVYPLVLDSVPNVRLHIVGRCNDEEQKKEWESISGITVKGYVDDIALEYYESDVCIAPVYAGAGTNIKVAEALQMHRPCVVAPTAYRGYEMLEKGKDIVVADNDASYAEAIVDLLSDPEKRNAIADNGFEKYEQFFSRQAFMDVVKDSLQSLL